MRARIDITEVEQATKIRAKYLRALENEEWSLLPGSTFVKSFLREYADFLGLDSRLLVEEYKLRYERPSEHELAPISPQLGADRRGGGPGMRAVPPWAVVGGLLLLVLVALWAVGSLVGGGESGSTTSGSTTDTSTSTVQRRAPGGTTPATPAQASVRIVPTGTIYVCLVAQNGKVLIPGTQFAAGQHVPVYRARSMRLTLGNNQLRLRVNGHSVSVPASSSAIAYAIGPRGAHALPLSQAPTCT